MRWSIETVTGPTDEAVTLAEAKGHLRMTGDESLEDEEITALISTARSHVERITGCRFRPQTVRVWFDAWPDGDSIELPVRPLVAVNSLKHYSTAEVATTVSAGIYHVDAMAFATRLVLRSGQSWPSAELRPARGVAVEAQVGGASMPELRHAVLLLIGHWYENLEAVSPKESRLMVTPIAVDRLIEPWRLRRG